MPSDSHDSGAALTRRKLLQGLGLGFAGLAGSKHLSSAAKAAPLGLSAGTTPEVLWDIQIPGSLYGNPLYSTGAVVLPLRSGGESGVLQAIDVQTQSTLWSHSLNSFPYTPVLANGILYAADLGGSLFAVDPASGQTLWRKNYQTNGELTHIRDRLLLYTNNGEIVALDLSGNLLWSYSTGQSLSGSEGPVLVAGDMVLVGLNRTVFALNLKTGSLLWQFQASNLVQGAVSADGQSIYFTSYDGLVWSLQPATGTVNWKWPNTAGSLSSPVAYSGLLYVVCGSNGVLYAIDPTKGQTAWQAELTSGETGGSQLFIEDGIAYTSFGFLSSNAKVFAVDLSSAGTRIVSLDIGGEGAIVGVENGVVYYTHKYGGNLAAANMADQLHQFFCETELMADAYVAGSSNRAQGSSPTFRTHVQLLDPNRNPQAYKSVKVTASAAVTITSGGKTYQIDSKTPAWLQTDGIGELSIVSQASTISATALYLWSNFMDLEEAIVIYPDYDTCNRLSQVQGQDLANATTYDGSPLLPSGYTGTDGLAAAVRNTMGATNQAVQSTKQMQARPAKLAGAPHPLPAGHRRKPRPRGGLDTYIAYPASTPNMLYQPTQGSTNRVYVAGSIPNWTASFSTNGVDFSPTSPSAPQTLLGLSWDDFWSAIVNGVRKVVHIVVQTAEDVVHQIIDDLGNLYTFVVDTVEKAISVVVGVLKTVVGDIVKAVEWLSYLFNWGDILTTKNELEQTLQTGFANLKTWVTQQQGTGFKAIHSFFVDLENDITGLLGNTSLGTMQSQQVNGNNPQTLYGYKGAKSYTKSRWLPTKLKDNAGQGSSVSLPGTSLGSLADLLGEFADTVAKTMSSSPNLKAIPSDLARVFTDFGLLITDPSSFITRSFSDIFKLFVDIAVSLVQLADAVVEAFLGLLGQFIDAILGLITTPISIPIISELWSLITGGSPLTILDVCSLMVAIPTTILSKIISAGQLSTGRFGGPVTLNQNIGYLFAAAFFAVFDPLSDIFTLGPVLTSFYLALSILLTGLGFPTDLASNSAGTYVFWALQVLPLVGIGATLAGNEQVNFAIPWSNMFYGGMMLFCSVELAKKYPAQFEGAKNLILVQNIFSFIPYCVKPLGFVGEDGAPNKLVLGAIDGACDLTVLGLGVAQWA